VERERSTRECTEALVVELQATLKEVQCVAVCCSVLQCVAACFSVLQRVAPRVRRHLYRRCRPCCSVLQRVAACCSVLHQE